MEKDIKSGWRKVEGNIAVENDVIEYRKSFKFTDTETKRIANIRDTFYKPEREFQEEALSQLSEIGLKKARLIGYPNRPGIIIAHRDDLIDAGIDTPKSDIRSSYNR